jgi:hypothetical protein
MVEVRGGMRGEGRRLTFMRSCQHTVQPAYYYANGNLEKPMTYILIHICLEVGRVRGYRPPV